MLAKFTLLLLVLFFTSSQTKRKNTKPPFVIFSGELVLVNTNCIIKPKFPLPCVLHEAERLSGCIQGDGSAQFRRSVDVFGGMGAREWLCYITQSVR